MSYWRAFWYGFTHPFGPAPKWERSCEHSWEYFEDPDHDYTGYLERCVDCGAIVQIPQ